MDVQPVIDRIGEEVPALAGRVEGALELAALLAENVMPQSTPHAYVVPLGLRGGRPSSATGFFTQEYQDTLGVLFFMNSSGDPTGARVMADVGEIGMAIVNAIAGWAPDEDVLGVYILARADLVSLRDGMVIYQIDFALDKQLRLQRS